SYQNDTPIQQSHKQSHRTEHDESRAAYNEGNEDYIRKKKNQLESDTNTNYSKNINICSQEPRRKESTQNCLWTNTRLENPLNSKTKRERKMITNPSDTKCYLEEG
ncbi:14091_t:CDS:2, partial [Gigaspora rosea]